MIVEARAPAKVIMVGEHFVVHGGYAIAAPISIWARVRAEGGRTLSIESPALPHPCDDRGCPDELIPFYEMLSSLTSRIRGATGRYVIESAIPMASGLGSSAAIAASLAAASLKLAGELPSPERVFEYSMIAERMVHGHPSGVDPAVASYGTVILYSTSDGIRELDVEGRRRMAICCTGRSRSTAKMIEVVDRFRSRNPDLFWGMLETSRGLALEASRMLEEGREEELAPIIRWHQNALRLLGVSTDDLDEVVELMEGRGFTAKLTGAGGGGCVIGLPRGRGVELPQMAGGSCLEVEYPSGGAEAWEVQ